jgi:uncharacterized protein (TIGR04551 family)
MSHPLLAALLVASATATAQTPAPQGQRPSPAPAQQATPSPTTPVPDAPPEPTAAPPAQQPAAAPPAGTPDDAIQREVDKRLEAVREEMREEIRAQMATQSATSEWQQEWTQEKRKLELFTLDGYFRMRPTMFYKFDLGKPVGRELFPRSPRSPQDNTQAGANMRARLEPSLNLSEEVRVKLQVDALDNVLLGSLPGDPYNTPFVIFSDTQNPPNSAVNALRDSVQVKRAYGEVSTPVGVLRFGRMGAHWGLGILRNDGDCLECDFGDNADRVQFVTEPFAGWYVTPMLEFGGEGVGYPSTLENSEPLDPSQSDDTTSWVLAIARRDTEQQRRSKLDNNQGVLNYGLFFTYRTQSWEAIPNATGGLTGFVPRDATLFIPDLWLRYEERLFRLEVELAAYLGSIGNRAMDPGQAGNVAENQSLRIAQFGGVAQGEYKLMDGKLSLGLELGFASGDKAPGFGNFPGRTGSGPGGSTARGDIEGPQYACGAGGCRDNAIRNFRFNRAYRVDLILWRELIGGITDAFYVKPGARYSITPGFDLYGNVIYSQAFYAESTPSGTNAGLGVEFDLGARYETEDGFVAGVSWGILFPLSGLQEPPEAVNRPEFETAQALRGTLGIKF